MAACARVCSLSAACRSLSRAPSRETIRRALLRWLPARDELPASAQPRLSVDAPCAWRRRPQQVAIDLTLIPYHGLPFTDVLEIYRAGQERHQSFPRLCHRLRQLSGSALHPGFDLGARGEKLPEVIQRLLRRLSQLGVSVRMLLLDRGFWSVSVIRYLQRARYPFLMPVVLRGRQADHPRGPSGTRVRRAQAGRLGRIHADRSRQTDGGCRSASTAATTTGSGGGTDGRRWCMPSGESNRRTRDGCAKPTGNALPSRRATVRCSKGRCAIGMRNPEVRLLLVGVALVLRNVWVWLHYAVLSTPRRGNRRFNLERLTLETLLLWLLHQAEQELGCRDHVCAEHPMPQ